MYNIYIADKYSYGNIKVKAKNETQAIREAKKYIKTWHLEDAYIDIIEKI